MKYGSDVTTPNAPRHFVYMLSKSRSRQRSGRARQPAASPATDLLVLREHAAVLCSQMADWYIRPGFTCIHTTPTGRRRVRDTSPRLSHPPAVRRLAEQARAQVKPRHVEYHYRTERGTKPLACCWAEAEALLRTGWTP